MTNEQKIYIRQNIGIKKKKQIAKDIGMSYSQTLRWCKRLSAMGVKGAHKEHIKWTDEDNKILMKVYAEPLTMKQKEEKISRLTGHPEASINSHRCYLNRKGVKVNCIFIGKYADIEEKLIRDYINHVKMKDMIKKYRLPDYTIRMIAHKAGVHRRNYKKKQHEETTQK